MSPQTLYKSIDKDYHRYNVLSNLIYQLLIWVPLTLIGVYGIRRIYDLVTTNQISADDLSTQIGFIPITMLIYMFILLCVTLLLNGISQEKICDDFSEMVIQNCLIKKYGQVFTKYLTDMNDDIEQQKARVKDISEMSMKDALDIVIKWCDKYDMDNMRWICGLPFERKEEIFHAYDNMMGVVLMNNQLRFYLLTDELIRKGIYKKHIEAFTSTLGVHRAKLYAMSYESLSELNLACSDKMLPIRANSWRSYMNNHEEAINEFCEKADNMLSDITLDAKFNDNLQPFIDNALSIATT